LTSGARERARTHTHEVALPDSSYSGRSNSNFRPEILRRVYQAGAISHSDSRICRGVLLSVADTAAQECRDSLRHLVGSGNAPDSNHDRRFAQTETGYTGHHRACPCCGWGGGD